MIRILPSFVRRGLRGGRQITQQNYKRIQIIISGRVQGVFFRVETYNTAIALGLTGCVKNLPDGRVEIVAEGHEDSITKLIEWAKHGPALAQVNDCQIEWQDPTGEYQAFKITN